MVPLDARVTDETGTIVRLGDLGGGKPLVLSLAALDDEEDRRAVQAGRWWHNVSGAPFLRGALIGWNPLSGKTMVTIRSSGSDRRDVVLTLSRFEKVNDQPILLGLSNLLPSRSGSPPRAGRR